MFISFKKVSFQSAKRVKSNAQKRRICQLTQAHSFVYLQQPSKNK
uniref:Uncharacterized protein n=1 Tax=Rhizophora mucronata TaxID=61149 RepID=A0A2P2ML41_RHIMU